MHLPRRCSVLILVAAAVLGSCSSDSSSSTAPTPARASTDSEASADTTGSAPAGAASDASATDCAALADALGRINVNWQIVIGLVDSPTTEWATLPIGTLSEFGTQLSTVSAGLGSDSAAADAISFMSAANDIVVRGEGGDASAQADLATYLGSDVTANVYKQRDVSLAFANSSCG